MDCQGGYFAAPGSHINVAADSHQWWKYVCSVGYEWVVDPANYTPACGPSKTDGY